MLAGSGSAMIAASSCCSVAATSASGSFQGTTTVAAVALAGTPGLAGQRLRRQPRAGLGEQAVEVAVVGARRTSARARGRSPRGRSAAPSSSPRCPRRSSAPSPRQRMRRATSSASSTSPSVGAPKLVPRAAASATACTMSRMRVPVDQRPPRAHVVDVAVAVDVDELGALAAGDEDRVAPDRPHRAHRRVHAARDHLQGAPVELGRSRVGDGLHERPLILTGRALPARAARA